MPDFGERGNRSTSLLNEQSLNPFRRVREEESQLRVERNIPEGKCIDCGGDIEEGRQKIGLPRCRECAFNQPSQCFDKKAAVF